MLTLANRGENHHFLCGDVYAPRELLLSEIASGRLKLTPAHQLDFAFYRSAYTGSGYTAWQRNNVSEVMLYLKQKSSVGSSMVR
jgi:hypothetical protein